MKSELTIGIICAMDSETVAYLSLRASRDI
ncbi:hypothetical protein IMSAG013_00112 [Clostridiales bacterium]|nr:hypothetical protein IMSAG013_00112 [Clostridiales bacterium]